MSHQTTTAAANELALDIKLGDSRPVGIFLDALAKLVGGEYVHTLVVDAEIIENLYNLAGKAALRKAGRALHEEHHVLALHFALDVVVDTAHVKSFRACGSQVGNMTFK